MVKLLLKVGRERVYLRDGEVLIYQYASEIPVKGIKVSELPYHLQFDTQKALQSAKG